MEDCTEGRSAVQRPAFCDFWVQTVRVPLMISGATLKPRALAHGSGRMEDLSGLLCITQPCTV